MTSRAKSGGLFLVWSCATVFLLLLPGIPNAAEKHKDEFSAPVASVHLAAIRFEGNKTTREQILYQEMRIRAGDTVTPDQIEEARQSLMDLGLFKRVRARLEEGPEGQVAIFSMEEKFYILPTPLVTGDPNKKEYSYGVELRVDNLGGYNQRLKLQFEQERAESKELPERKKGSVSYNYPRLLGTPYALSMNYSLSQDDYNALDPEGEIILARYHRNITSLSGGLSRWFKAEGPSRGWSGGMGLSYVQQEYILLGGQAGLHETAEAISVTANVSMTNVHDRVYYFEGEAYGWNGEVGSRLFGSSYEYTRNLFYYRNYHHFGERRNLNWQMRLGIADGEIFGNPTYKLGGYTTLRGYEKGVTGNAYALSNLEYQEQVDGYPALRGVVFLDVGNAYRDLLDIDPSSLEAGMGVGFRWRIQQLVNVTLSADAAYGLGPQKQVFYFMTSGTF